MPSAIAKWRTQMSIALLVILASSAGSASASQIVAWGNPDNLQTNIPADLTNAVAIGAGSAYGIALLQSGTVRSWGNDYGGAGPVPAGLSNVTAIAAGLHHTLALKSDGT